MAAKLVLAPEAMADVEDAYNWYEAQRVGLGEDFLGRVEACLQAIVRAPEMHAVIQLGDRRALVRRFPYAVFHEFADDTVTVYCVSHTSKDPEKWRTRLP